MVVLDPYDVSVLGLGSYGFGEGAIDFLICFPVLFAYVDLICLIMQQWP
jgi:hypothetical protein